MDTNRLKKFAQAARRKLLEQVKARVNYVLNSDTPELREKSNQVNDIRKEIKTYGEELFIRRIAYTWFNRFMALRFMDANDYTDVKVVSAIEGFTQPEILDDAKKGIIDEKLKVDRSYIARLLTGKINITNPQNEAYKILLLESCHVYNKIMPFIFEKLNDYTELLMPDDLLSEKSIIFDFMTLSSDDIAKVESIGWMYQFYISEKKDEVFEGLKKNIKVTPENIPAATQLFTPHWIVRYMVENSLGRLWMLNNPDSKLKDHMDYYIDPEEKETDFLKISSPEDLKICDPACGSGHILVYAFDLLTKIYEEKFYEKKDIPRLILKNNLYGVEIDSRAGALSAFALTMKAREYDRRFFRRTVEPNICILKNVEFTDDEMSSYMSKVGEDLFNIDLRKTLLQFDEADNFGSLVVPVLKKPKDIFDCLKDRVPEEDLFMYPIHQKVLTVIEQADYLSSKYHCVIANPPYMGGKGMNARLSTWAKSNYSDSKSDLFAMFIERGFELVIDKGYNTMVTMQSWMFLSSYEKLREKILSNNTIDCMVHMANMVMGIAFGTAATVWHKLHKPDYKGDFSYVFYEDLTKENKPREFPVQNDRLASASASDFKKIPGSPIAYWVSNKVREIFYTSTSLREIAYPRQGLATTNNDLFLRKWYEVTMDKVGIGYSKSQAINSCLKWFPLNKGGSFRKWFGNNDFIVNFEYDGKTICDYIDNTPNVRVKSNGRVINRDRYFQEGMTWSTISSGLFSMRYSPQGSIFETKGAMCFCENRDDLLFYLSYLNTKIVQYLLNALSPTLDYHEGPLGKLPVIFSVESLKQKSLKNVSQFLRLSKKDWNNFETSWDFTDLPILREELKSSTLKETWQNYYKTYQNMTSKMQELEEENNRIFIEAYGLQDELTPEVPLKEITLTGNPVYRYGDGKTAEEYEDRMLADTMKEFISYAVGCMIGRYSLDKPGLILANQGETTEDYYEKISDHGNNGTNGSKEKENFRDFSVFRGQCSFVPDDDNVIPILEVEWFTDDMAERFKEFLKVTFDHKNYEKNLNFLETAIGKDIRKYFVKDFFNDHVKRYKKRPIYWQYSSPKKYFSVLIYMHRYKPDTVSVILNDYLREYQNKLNSHKEQLNRTIISESIPDRDKRKAQKELDLTIKIIKDLEDYEKNILYPLATEKIKIDLDDGVKINYPKFGKALSKIAGLN